MDFGVLASCKQGQRPPVRIEPLFTSISNLKCTCSPNTTPGGGAHATHFYGSPVIEQAAFDYVKTKLIENMITAVKSTPGGAPITTNIEVDMFIEAQCTYLSNLKMNPLTVFENLVDQGWAAHYIAPCVAALGGARQAFLATLRQHQFLNLIA
eukprot:PhF_6_TR26052/c1_g3_i3/m.36696